MSSTAILPSIFEADFAAADLLRPGSVERVQQVRIGRKLGIHRAQQRRGRELPALVDPNRQRVFLGHVHFDPRSAFGDHAATRQLAIGGRVLLQHEVDARTPVQLTDDHSLGTVNDELAAAHHDRQVAKINFLLVRLLAIQSQPDPQRAPVCQSKLPALLAGVAGFAELVVQVLQRAVTVVTADRKDFAQHALQTMVLALFRINVFLQKSRIRNGLQRRQVWQLKGCKAGSKVANAGGLEATLGRGCHRV